MGSYQTIELIETFVNYAESIKRCICIIYDPQRSGTGTLALKAIKLRESFIKARRLTLCGHARLPGTDCILATPEQAKPLDSHALMLACMRAWMSGVLPGSRPSSSISACHV